MTLKQTFGIAALALTAFTTEAHAANHEIFLGFRTTAIGDNDMIVNLGVFSTLPASGVITNINADLAATFGANWNTRTDLFFGAAGASTLSPRVAYVSNFADGFTGSPSANSLAGNIIVLDQIKWNSTNAITTNKGTQGVNTLVSIKADNNASGWSVKAGSGSAVFTDSSASLTRSEWEASTDFSLVTSKSFALSSATNGIPGWANNLGGASYYLDSAGNVGVSAIPEPSTYGLMGAGALGAIALIRRRKSAKA